MVYHLYIDIVNVEHYFNIHLQILRYLMEIGYPFLLLAKERRK